jgi:hypothetical protein
MKRLLLPLAALAIPGLLLGSAPRAYACSCAGLPTSDSDVRRFATEVDVAVIVAIRPPEPGDKFPDRMYVSVETMFVGPEGDELALEQPWGRGITTEDYGPDCSYTLAEVPGKRYFLTLQGSTGGKYRAGWCSSFPLAGPVSYPPAEQREPFLEALRRVTEDDERQDARDQAAPSEDEGFPWLTVVIGSSAGAAGLATAAWLVRRASRG